jgi:hypothetical protein
LKGKIFFPALAFFGSFLGQCQKEQLKYFFPYFFAEAEKSKRH